MYEEYIWILVLRFRGKCKRAIYVNKNIKKKKLFLINVASIRAPCINNLNELSTVLN